MLITQIRHDWPEKSGFLITRPKGHKIYTFLHFTTAIQLKINNEIIDARPGACVFFEPNIPQWFHSNTDMVHNWFHANICIKDLLNEFDIPRNVLLYPENPAFISDIFRMIELEYFSQKPNKEKLIEAYVKEFLIKFSRAIKGDMINVVLSRNLKEKMRSARQYILSKPDQCWMVADMAKLVSMSPSRFHVVYKTLFATSPMRDLINAKVDYAKSLLLSDENKTLVEISEKLGYNDQYHFIRQFKAVTGKTPGAYRKSKR